MFEQIEQAKQEWEVTLDALPQLVCLLDSEGRVLRVNRTLERWQMGSVIKAPGHLLHELMHPTCEHSCRLRDFLTQAIAQESASELEYNDELLNRYFLVRVEPVARRERVQGENRAVIVQDISRQKQDEESLRLYSEALEAQNAELDAFAHTVAHDLKSPLAIIMGMAELIAEAPDLYSMEELRQELGIISQSSQKAIKIIEELLLLASVRKQEIQLTPVDMGAVLAEVWPRVHEMTSNAQTQIVLPEAWPPVLGYAPWLEEVWFNFVSNGIKYGGHPPRLELNSTLQTDGMVRFWVRDNGPGISAEKQALLFTPFTRLQQSNTKGHGLGLSIAKRIIERLHGNIGVESNGNDGSCFYFTLQSLS